MAVFIRFEGKRACFGGAQTGNGSVGAAVFEPGLRSAGGHRHRRPSSASPVRAAIPDASRRRRTLRQFSGEGDERAPAFHPGTWMHHLLQLLLPAAGLIDIDRNPPRIGSLVFKSHNSSEQFRRLIRRIDGQQDRAALWIKRDDDAASIGLPALPWGARKLRAAVAAQKRQGQNPRLVKIRRPIRIVGKNSHGA